MIGLDLFDSPQFSFSLYYRSDLALDSSWSLFFEKIGVELFDGQNWDQLRPGLIFVHPDYPLQGNLPSDLIDIPIFFKGQNPLKTTLDPGAYLNIQDSSQLMDFLGYMQSQWEIRCQGHEQSQSVQFLKSLLLKYEMTLSRFFQGYPVLEMPLTLDELTAHIYSLEGVHHIKAMMDHLLKIPFTEVEIALLTDEKKLGKTFSYMFQGQELLFVFTLKNDEKKAHLEFLLMKLVLDFYFLFEEGTGPHYFPSKLSCLEDYSFPVLLVDKESGAFFYNQLFMQLDIGPSQLIELSHGDIYNMGSESILINKTHLFIEGKGLDLFYLTLEKKMAQQNNFWDQENIKVITSSIAHELKNPIAGIMAAIDLLLLDEWEEDCQEILKDLKKSSKRCRDLVEVFLGFSRPQNQVLDEGIESVFMTAKKLLQVRMLDLNFKIEMKNFTKESCFSRPLNYSQLTILLYLFFSDLMTNMSRQELIEGRLYREIHFDLIEREQEICFLFNGRDLSIQGSPLGQFILNLLGLELEMKGQYMRLLNTRMI